MSNIIIEYTLKRYKTSLLRYPQIGYGYRYDSDGEKNILMTLQK